ncbi:MAG TPA: HEPN domain-containing protein [Anaerolineales bacterium]|nr:HEPN domain-containing protein [Anaerolineales bacterium]
MNSEVRALLEKAKRSQKAAAKLFKDGDVDFAASRAYYSLFYTAEALLLSRELSFSSHSAVIANFGKEFAKTGTLNSKFHHYLMESQDRRNIGDYSVLAEVTAGQVREMLVWAKEFIKAAEDYLKQAF